MTKVGRQKFFEKPFLSRYAVLVYPQQALFPRTSEHR